MYNKPIPILLLTDFYKTCHRSFYSPGTTQLVSYWTPRRDRTERIGYVVMFWLQAYIKTYLLDRFEETFFSRPWEEVRQEYVDYISATFDPQIAAEEIEAFRAIHELGYLPIEIRAIPEGVRVPIGCPMIEIRATQEWAFWVGEYFETIASCNLWPAMTSATIADSNRRLLEQWYAKTVDDDVPRSLGAGDFSMRGTYGEHAAILADAGHLLSFRSTATVPTMWVLHNLYHADFDVAKGTPSTEHSVMESYGPERELEAYRHIAAEVRPNGVLSMVSDTWNLWRVLTEYLPTLKDQLMLRDGKIVIRPDSGNPVDILCGQPGLPHPVTPEEKGVVELLWELVGGTVNSKGYKVLDPHFGVIYGDAITHESEHEIFARLAAKGFAACNVTLGFGSFTYQYVTRDTFGFALKVTHGIVNGQELPMFKDPITDRGAHSAGKKSQRGMCVVHQGADGTLSYTDGHTIAEADGDAENLLRPVFRNGVLLVDEDFTTIRNRLHPNF